MMNIYIEAKTLNPYYRKIRENSKSLKKGVKKVNRSLKN